MTNLSFFVAGEHSQRVLSLTCTYCI